MKAGNTPTDDPRFPDEETKKIVEQMKAEGQEAPVSEEPKPEEPKEEPKEKEPEKPEEPEQKPESEEPEPVKVEEPKGEEGKKVEEKPKKREVLIPITKVKQNEKILRDESEKKLQEKDREISDLKNKIATLESGSSGDQVDKISKIATDVASRHDASPELVSDILKSAAELQQQGTTLPKEVLDQLEAVKAIKAEMDERKRADEIVAHFDDEFATEFTSQSESARVMTEEIRSSGLTMKEFKERLQNKVLGEGGEKYERLSLTEAYQLLKAELLPKKSKSADASRGRTTTGKTETDNPRSIDDYSPEEIAEMSDEEFERLSTALGKNSKSKVIRRGRPIN